MRLTAALLGVAAMLASGALAAQSYPSAKPIRIIVGFPAGSSVDTIARVVLDDVRARTGATIIVDNRPGALGQIGTEAVAKAAPDGYTLMPSASATHSSGPQLSKTVNYDPIKDFTHITNLVRFDVMLVVNPTQGFKSVQDLVAAARAKPDDLTYGYGSATGQVVASSFSRSAGLKVRGVPYKGQPLALNDLMGGQINFVTADVSAILSHVRSGKLSALAIASHRRSTILPNVPTLTEVGVKDVELSGWVGVSGPAKMPAEIVAWWEKHLTAALADGKVIERMRGMAVEPELMTGEAFRRFVVQQYGVWGKRIREAGMEPQ